jgi:protein-disulfide isomerase
MYRPLVTTLSLLLGLLMVSVPGLATEQPHGARQEIDISGHPFLGPAAAPVTVVVFSDYL